MYFVSSILFIAILIFLRLFYASFVHDEDIYFIVYNMSNLEFVIFFYGVLALILYLLVKKIKLEFILVQLVFSASLFVVGEYTYLVFLQFVFLFILFESEKMFLKTLVFSLYLLALHKALLLLFASSYPLYFIDLSLIIYTLFIKINIFKKFKEINGFIYLLAFALIFTAIVNMRNFIFDFTIWLDMNDTQNYQVYPVVYFLSCIHILIYIALKRLSFKLD